MSEGFETIRNLGSQKIHERTHISRKSIDNLLEKNFEDMTKVQVSGFISILEREYAVDLSALKEEYDAYCQAHLPPEESTEILIPPSKNERSKRWLVIGVIAVLLIAVMSVSVSKDDEKASEPVVLTESGSAAVDADPVTLDEPEENLSMGASEPKELVEPVGPALPEHLAVIPSTELWMGFIDLSSYEKGQKLTAEPFELNATKDWLIVFGHGYFSFEVGDEVQKFNDKNKLWFVYEGGVLKKITNEEFKMRNRGSNW